MVFVDPHSEADRVLPNPQNPMGMQAPRNSDLGRVFDAWGIELVDGKVVGDLPLAKKVNFQKQSRMMVADYPIWIDLTPRQLNAEDVVTAKLPNLTMASAGVFRKKEDSAIEWTPLMETDDQAMQIDAARLRMMPDVEGLLRDYRPEGETLVLAARLTGKVKRPSPMAGRKPRMRTDQETPGRQSIKTTPAPGRIRGPHKRHRGSGYRHAAGPVLGTGPKLPGPADRDSHLRE